MMLFSFLELDVAKQAHSLFVVVDGELSSKPSIAGDKGNQKNMNELLRTLA